MTIRDRLERLRERGEMALMPYFSAGFASLEDSMRHIETAAQNGADLIEVGVPFSDPVADGPTIQAASQTALAGGCRLPRILDALGQIRVEAPLILMSYLNPLLAYGRERLLADMARARVVGLIVPDLPLEESAGWADATRAAGISLVLLVAPTTTEDRIRRIAERSDGFVYYVSVTGTTGSRRELPRDLFRSLDAVRAVTDMPVAVGFGISTADQVRRLRGRADGVVVGSRLVEAIRRGEDLSLLIRQLKAATRNATADEAARVDPEARPRSRSGL